MFTFFLPEETIRTMVAFSLKFLAHFSFQGRLFWRLIKVSPSPTCHHYTHFSRLRRRRRNKRSFFPRRLFSGGGARLGLRALGGGGGGGGGSLTHLLVSRKTKRKKRENFSAPLASLRLHKHGRDSPTQAWIILCAILTFIAVTFVSTNSHTVGETHTRPSPSLRLCRPRQAHSHLFLRNFQAVRRPHPSHGQ